MKIASWNVNSINARLDHVKRYLEESSPDILMLQEIKTLDFPSINFKSLGYHTHCVTQKSYNGVALISKHPIKIISDKLAGDVEDTQARYVEAKINDIRVINIYAPNGNPAPSNKYDYKLAWMERLYIKLRDLCEACEPFLIGGDFNVIPEAKDCNNAKEWENNALFLPETRAAYKSFLHLGLNDAFRMFNKSSKQYTFWDYQTGAWQKNNGLRIDLFLLSPFVADMATDCCINKTPRSWDKPSDHTPIELKIRT